MKHKNKQKQCAYVPERKYEIFEAKKKKEEKE